MSVYSKVSPNQNLEKFLKDMEKMNKEIKETSPRFPYTNHDNCKAYLVDNNGKTFYFCFGSEGQLLQKIII